jgi:hypothetical protein
LYAGFITTKRVTKKVGVHQRFDSAAYRMIMPYLAPNRFPTIKQILHFEGYHGPDGLKVKTPINPSHFYDPVQDIGELPGLINMHYRGLVKALVADDQIKASFEAAWLAHYVADGMTPAHHFPFEEKMAELRDGQLVATTVAGKVLAMGEDDTYLQAVKKGWQVWGPKGLFSTHHNFEIGIAFALIRFTHPGKLDERTLVRARRVGPVEFFKLEAREIAQLNLYERFYAEGWNADIAGIVKNVIAPKTSTAIGIIWLLAMLEAEQREVMLHVENFQR